MVQNLREAGLVDRSRIIMEKPFGTDLPTAKVLNDAVHAVFSPEQVYRIDHFLGKEAAQNILAFRFANGLFEPIWNRGHIDHVQIDVPETLSVDRRAGFYEGTGAFRDMVVTHLFQVLAFMAMEPPTSLEPGRSARRRTRCSGRCSPSTCPQVVRGQYEGYRSIPGVARGLPDRDVHRPQVRDRQLALGRRAVLPADRQAAWPRAPGSSRSPSGSRRRACSPPVRGWGPTGPDHLTFDLADAVQAVPVLLRQAARVRGCSSTS